MGERDDERRVEKQEARPGWVLFIPDPYCWWPQADVTPYFGRPEYEVRLTDPHGRA